MDENLDNAAQDFERKLDDAAENAWKPVNDAAEQVNGQVADAHEAAQEKVEEAAETVQSSWSEVKDEFQQASAESWSAPEAPQTPPPPQPEADRWGAPVNAGADDPSRWNNDLYTPGADEPTSTATKAEEAPKVVDYVAASTEKPAKKDSFPVWAIILIVVLVLCLCILCPLLVLGGAGWRIFENSGSFLPTLFFFI